MQASPKKPMDEVNNESQLDSVDSFTKPLSVFEKQYNYFKVKEEDRVNTIRKANMEEIMRCPFNPSILNPRPLREFDQFLREQDAHSKKHVEELEGLIALKKGSDAKKYSNAPHISDVRIRKT